MAFFKERFYENLWSNKHITYGHWLGLVIVSLIMLIIIFDSNYYSKEMNKMFNRVCFYKCSTNKCKNILRQTKGSDYYIGGQSAILDCFIGFWEISHFITHVFLGYYFNMYYSLVLGVGFEIAEASIFQCESYMDFIFNTLGALLGIALRTSLEV